MGEKYKFWRIVLYHVYCLTILAFCSYVVFEGDESGWYFLLAWIFINNFPDDKK